MIFCKIVIVAILILNLGFTLAKHGEIETKRYNFWTTLVGTGIEFLLFWGAGLFR